MGRTYEYSGPSPQWVHSKVSSDLWLPWQSMVMCLVAPSPLSWMTSCWTLPWSSLVTCRKMCHMTCHVTSGPMTFAVHVPWLCRQPPLGSDPSHGWQPLKHHLSYRLPRQRRNCLAGLLVVPVVGLTVEWRAVNSQNPHRLQHKPWSQAFSLDTENTRFYWAVFCTSPSTLLQSATRPLLSPAVGLGSSLVGSRSKSSKDSPALWLPTFLLCRGVTSGDSLSESRSRSSRSLSRPTLTLQEKSAKSARLWVKRHIISLVNTHNSHSV